MNYIDFKYYLRYFAGGVWHYYYVDNAGTVQDTTTKTELTYTPKNWDDIVLTWERGFTYHGIFQAFTVPIEFVKDGAKILRHLYVYYGTEGACQLYIEKFMKIYINILRHHRHSYKKRCQFHFSELSFINFNHNF